MNELTNINNKNNNNNNNNNNMNIKNNIINNKNNKCLKSNNGISVVNMGNTKYSDSLRDLYNLPNKNLRNLNVEDKNDALLLEKIIKIINFEFENNKSRISSKRNKLIKDKNKYINKIDSKGFESGFDSILIKNGIKNLSQRFDINSKIKILDVWYNQMISSNLDKRCDIFKEGSIFYKELSEIINSGYLSMNPTLRQVRIERWLLDYENYKIRNMIDNEVGYPNKSTESIIYSNLFKIFDKNWNYAFSKYIICLYLF